MMEFVNPPALGRPRGFSHGVVAPPGARLLFVAGQTAADATGEIAGDFLAQFEVALDRVLQVVRAAGGEPQQVARLTIYVTDMPAYHRSRPQLGEVWQRHMGRHYPAMALVAVAGLVDAGAMVEIDAHAVLP